VAGAAAVVAGLVAFFVLKKRRRGVEERLNQDAEVARTDATLSAELGDDHAFVSEYGFTDHAEGDD
jgi:hypothetical protein